MFYSIIYMVAIVCLVGCAIVAVAVCLIDKNAERNERKG